jgi:hypothetical protein
MFGAVGAYANQSEDDDAGHYPAAKQALLDQYRAQVAQGNAHPAARNDLPPVPSFAPLPLLQPGIDERHEGPFGSATFTVQNHWQGQVDGQWTNVYAGAVTGNGDGVASFPALRVYSSNRNPNEPADIRLLGVFRVPGDAGASAKITGVQGFVLTVVTTDGTESQFDLSSEASAG